MSTYVGYVCKSHTPDLPSEHWFNRGEETLTDAYRKVRAGTWPIDDEGDPRPVSNGSYSTARPIYWLQAHQHCTVSLQDEYGREAPLEQEQPMTETPTTTGHPERAPERVEFTAGGSMHQTVQQVAPEPRDLDYRATALGYAIQVHGPDASPGAYIGLARTFETYLREEQAAATEPAETCGEWIPGIGICRRLVENGQCPQHGEVGP